MRIKPVPLPVPHLTQQDADNALNTMLTEAITAALTQRPVARLKRGEVAAWLRRGRRGRRSS